MAYDINIRNLHAIENLVLLKKENPKINIQRMGLHTYFKIFCWKDRADYKNREPLVMGYNRDTGSSGPLDISKLNKGEYVKLLFSFNTCSLRLEACSLRLQANSENPSYTPFSTSSTFYCCWCILLPNLSMMISD